MWRHLTLNEKQASNSLENFFYSNFSLKKGILHEFDELKALRPSKSNLSWCMFSRWKFQRLLVLMRGSYGKIFRSISCVLRKIHTNQGTKIALFLCKNFLWNFIEQIDFFVWKSLKNCRCCEGPLFQNNPQYTKKINRKVDGSKKCEKSGYIF